MLIVVAALIVCVSLGFYAFRMYSTPRKGADHREVGDISSKPKELDEARISELSTPNGTDESIDTVGHAPPAIDGDACSSV